MMAMRSPGSIPSAIRSEREGFDVVAIFAPGDFLIEPEILVAQRHRIGPRRHAFDEQLRHALAVDRPGAILVMFRNVVPEVAASSHVPDILV